MKIVLASTSRYRRELVGRLGLHVECAAPPYDETSARRALGPVPVADVVRALARGKALSLGESHPDALIVGADQLGEVDGEALGKPGTEPAARDQLRRLAGREHRLYTAVCVYQPATGRTEEALDVHRLAMRDLTDEAIADYVTRDRPLDCAGAYKVESLGIALFERVSGDDFTAVVGLPLTALVGLLGRFGVRVLG